MEVTMSEERRKILEMLSKGKISVDEAERLLTAVSEGSEQAPSQSFSSGSKLKYLRVLVEPAPDNKNGDRVNIRVPLNLIRAGLKWAAFIPKHAQEKVDEALKEKGIDVDFNKMKPEDLEEIIVNLNDLQVDVEGAEKVRIFCE
jgi:hypothetical protein